MISVGMAKNMVKCAGKREADRLSKIDIRWLKQQGYLIGLISAIIEWPNSFSDEKNAINITVSTLGKDNYIHLRYTQTEDNNEKKEFDYKVTLTTTPCNYGAERYWFICPLSINGKYCSKRVATLYKAGDYFGCRHCYNLTYKSRNENRDGKYHFLTVLYNLEDKIDKLSAKMRRKYYAGKPTKLQKRLDEACSRLRAFY
ncbi:MAG: hypothetical protein KKB81_02835 [Candidatus Margulisbacteria bacterium]|nr:hypothetical protein [Candidatus Margulisiibacteriota bacterium]MBU1022187.1 hypothetical protein [Candidatus Margulisiibacteriota bacterium]MBU1729374.1 hypothetical protein [Candidatus Margulisiibacteriota bacterium]MBU1955647.1 hypothetical protein [Candidatus Margulisiibacteriota bacterium]